MKTATEDLENRRPVWEALSKLFLDADTSLSREWRVAKLAASPYSLEELEQILIEEVYPVRATNPHCVGGVWHGFDVRSLEDRILKRDRITAFLSRFSLARFTLPRFAEWKRTKDRILNLRNA